jgi:hypothetical protein
MKPSTYWTRKTPMVATSSALTAGVGDPGPIV